MHCSDVSNENMKNSRHEGSRRLRPHERKQTDEYKKHEHKKHTCELQFSACSACIMLAIVVVATISLTISLKCKVKLHDQCGGHEWYV